MSGFDYAKSKATADRLIERFGQDVTIQRVTDAGDAWNPTQTSVDHTAKAAILDYSISEIDGSLVLRTDRKALVAKGGLTIEPKPSDTMTIGGVVHSIMASKPLSPAGIVVYYECQVRL